MKLSKYILLLALTCGMPSCLDLDIPPLNVVQDDDVFGTENGVKSYLARLYSQQFIEDFRYSHTRGFNNSFAFQSTFGMTGEALNRDIHGAETESNQIWNDAYKLIRETNYFLETLPKYASNFSKEQVDNWMGEAYFTRAFTYHALAKRYGGVPIVNSVLKYPDQPIEELTVNRSSEEAVYEQMEKDFDEAYKLLPETSQKGRANKYVAAAFKARAMLFAGSIAKYNEVDKRDDKDNTIRVCGVSREKAKEYFKKSYDAACLLKGKYTLYKDGWKADDKQAQYQNYVDMYFAENSRENIFIRQYKYPESVHGYDAYNIPRQFRTNGWTASTSPTLSFVEMFEGFPKNAQNKIQVFDENGKYKLYNTTMELFENAEPRLRAIVILPGDELKGEQVEIWRGIYTGEVANGISRLQLSDEPAERYENDPHCKDLIISSQSAENQTVRVLPNGEKMNASGRSGCFYDNGECTIAGFAVRKWIDPSIPAALVMERRSEQAWLEMRYAEVLLTRAEAAVELAEEGAADADYMQDAFDCINEIRERAGATLLTSKAELTKEIVRVERRKELSFENKVWWDMRRWRTAHREQNSTLYRSLFPFYAEKAGKWFFDARPDDKNKRFTFDERWYYNQIPNDEITKSGLTQNPGY
ncbi:RagB/SusD family nutrient uptake outer membrane protein [Parabacteroides chinchillae]|uniref:Starch-binding associating with outer membrane n=1 Tax=Parabacteroides chinchillae TaxID=871327 RepID=A0A8G2BTK0_9BACT|nr:RagB/SusD family nutrient uptake outer membrane protein [Parabacteroides chinchillae]SEF41536.1 Starch-binding associating with outer membrane [Parabacteroides chinchillae]